VPFPYVAQLREEVTPDFLLVQLIPSEEMRILPFRPKTMKVPLRKLTCERKASFGSRILIIACQLSRGFADLPPPPPPPQLIIRNRLHRMIIRYITGRTLLFDFIFIST
jgi:hypothetical protein